MSKITDKAAHDKVIRARTNLLVSNGFFGFLALQLRIVEATEIGGHKIDTMAVDGISMFYNPKFVTELSERELEGVTAHEVMHCAFQHFSRRQSRDGKLWNIAGDFVINADLLEAGFVLPGQPIGFDMLKDPAKGKGVKGHLFDPQFKGMNTEEIYEKLYQAATKISITFVGDGDPGGCGGVMDAPGDQTAKDAAEHEWETSVRMAVQVAMANNAGNIPGSLKRLIATLQKPKVSWRDKTRAFIDQSMIKDVSWSRISRRSVSIGTLMPGLISDRMNHLVFFVDDSGSINLELLTEFLSEVAGALDEGVADQLTVAYADTRVHHTDHFVPGDIVAPHELPNGGGGTAFSDSFRWLKENVPDASCVIYLTDLQVHDFGEDPGCPTLWAVYAPDGYYEKLAEAVPFGIPIQVSNMVG